MSSAAVTRPRTTVTLVTLLALLLGTLVAALGVQSPAGATPDIPFPDGSERRYALGIDPALATDASLRGTVLGPAGQLRDNVLVEAFSALDPLGDPVASALTYEVPDLAAHGGYDLRLPAGDYVVRFSTPDGATPVLEPAYYGGGTGTPVTLAADQVRTLDPVRLQRDRGAPVTGRVVGADDGPMTDIGVTLTRLRPDGDVAQIETVWTGEDGTFRFDRVRRGRTFTLWASGAYDLDGAPLGLPNTYLGDAPSPLTADTFTLGSRSTGHAVGDLHHVAGTSVTGHAASVDGAAEGDLALIHVSDDGTAGAVVDSAWVDADRDTLQFTAHPGRYTLGLLTYDEWGDPESWLFLGNTTKLAQATVFTVGSQAYDAGTVTDGADTARVTFQVLDRDGYPAGDLWRDPVVVDRTNHIIARASGVYDEDGEYTGRFRARVPWATEFSIAVYDDWEDQWVYLGDVRASAQARFLTAARGTTTLDAGTLSLARPAPTAPTPLLAGKARTGQVLAVSLPDWSVPDVTSTYQWLRDGTPIAGATTSSYLLRAEDVGHRVAVRVRGRADGRTPGEVTSTALTVGPGEAPTAITGPSITGSARAGGTLTTRLPVWDTDGVTSTLQWYADGRRLPGASGATLALGWQHAGSVITVVATATRPGHLPGTSTSAAVRVAAATPVLTVVPVKKGSAVRVQVRAPGALPVLGRLTLLDGSRSIGKVDLTRTHRGVFTFSLGRLSRGKHQVSASYAGSTVVAGARSRPVTVKVR